jgi:hypothetical protein
LGGTRWRQKLREAAAILNRELRITLTPVPRPDKWAFVIGCYNSGTTLLAEVLGTHPRISALPDEGQYLTDQIKADHELGLSRMWVKREDLYRLTETDAGPDVQRLKKEWGMRLDTGKPILLEKSPPNAARTLWLQEHFEDAHFIAIIRNGYAVAEGIRRKARPSHPERWPLEDCAYAWKRVNEVIAEDSSKLRNFIWVKYEDFADKTPETLNRIFAFLGIPGDPELNMSREWAIHERREAISNLNEESIGRLSPEDVAVINRVAGEALARFGYPIQPE